MIGKPSAKYKYVGGEPTYVKMMYQELTTPLQGVEGNQVCANDKYVAIPWKGGGGPFTVKLHEEQGRVGMNTPQFKAHTGAVQDMDFSPFHQNMLATASADATLRLWQMPDGPMTENVTSSQATLNGHTKKVMLMKWHPSSEFTIGSTSMNGGVRIWDVQMERTQFHYDKNTSSPWSMAWNYNGSLVSVLTKDKKMHIIDPRQQAAVAVNPAHQGSKAQRTVWNGRHGLHISVGYSDFGDREYMVYDQRDWSKPITQKQLDTNTQVLWTHYDDITGLFFVTNKGSTFTQVFYFSAEGERQAKPEMVPLTSYNGKEGTHYFFFLPKHAVDPLRKEVVRGLRFTGKAAEFVTFKLPRKEADFSHDLFPPHRAQKPAMTFDEWAKGKDEEPILEEFDPVKLQEGIKDKISNFVFEKKEGAGAPKLFKNAGDDYAAKQAATSKVGGAIPSGTQVSGGSGNAAEISRLNQEINAQKSVIAANEKTIQDLKEQLTAAEHSKAEGPMEPLTKPCLGYYDIRGQGQPIRYLLGYAKVDYDEQVFTQEDMGGCLPALPYLTDTKGKTEKGDTVKILKALAQQYKPELLEQSEDDKINTEMIAKYCNILNKALSEFCYGKQMEQSLEDLISEKLTPITSYLKGQDSQFILGDKICYLDFYLYEITELLDFLTSRNIFTNYPELTNHATNMGYALSEFYNTNHQSLYWPFFHRFTQTNNWPEVNWKN